MAHTHEYDCIVCGAHLDSLRELDQHNRENHQPRRADTTEPVGNEKPRNRDRDRDDTMR